MLFELPLARVITVENKILARFYNEFFPNLDKTKESKQNQGYIRTCRCVFVRKRPISIHGISRKS